MAGFRERHDNRRSAELIASTQRESPSRSAAAFVAGTAQQILARRQLLQSPDQLISNIDRDQVDWHAAD